MESKNVSYNLDHPVFQKNPFYKRLAKEHLSIADLESDTIFFEVKETVSPLNIPVSYHVHYNLLTIVGINEDQSPVYGSQHTAEVRFPPKYPIEPPVLYMRTPVWHPNIKYDGRFQGRICGNTESFGKAYEFSQLVLRIGEILEYKNYHALNIPPYPEDARVAKWVLEYGEPNNIVSAENGLLINREEGTGLEKRAPLLIKRTFDETYHSTQSELDRPKIKLNIRTREESSKESSKIKISIKRKK